ncbi:unnamed protein product [Cunninghamella blakesleeana]
MVSQLILTLPCIIAAINLVQAKVKGVSPEKQSLYKSNNQQQWTCLDGSLTIPFTSINDDYCDCPDGSDEPGTSACPNTYFYCENKGHLPAYIKSWAVNDGVCDSACCDGSDEYNGLIKCPNKCKEMSIEYQKVQYEIRKLTEEGYAAKKKLIEEGKKIIQEWELEKTRYEDELVMKRGELKRYQLEVEELEREHSGQKSSPSSSTKSTKHQSIKQNNAYQKTLEVKIKALKEDIDLLLSILHDLKRDHNHNFHDMAVKSAISGYEEFLAEYEAAKNDDEYNQVDDTEEYEDELEDVEEFANEEVDETVPIGKQEESITKKIFNKLESTIPTGWKNKLHKYIATEKENGNEIELETARKNRDDLENIIRDIENKLNDVNGKLNRDYGKEYEWLKLKDTCVDKDDGEYIYSLCILGGANQKSHKDGSYINLGQFDKFSGKDNLYLEHDHLRGLRCWNGPERSVHAIYECGSITEILDVMEPEKCEYHFRVRTPAVCSSPDQPLEKKKEFIHEEL